jgi:hypothetical protein
VNDQLSQSLDWTTFKLGEVSFGDTVVSTMGGKESCDEQIPIGGNMAVQIQAQIASDTGLASWTLRTLDLGTGELPEDALAGFLPPNDANGSGQGYVTFTVNAKKDIAAGTKISNLADIVFDTEAPIKTNEVFNTVTNDAPDAASLVLSLSDGATGVEISTVLNWNAVEYATSYDLWLWESEQDKPDKPAAADIASTFYDLTAHLESGKSYKWQIVAKNVMGESESPVRTFTAASSLNSYLRDAIRILKMLTGTDTDGLSSLTDINDDKQLGLPEVIFLIQKAAELR